MQFKLTKISGNKASKVSAPKEIFGQEINPDLLAQAVRVYQFNKRQGTAKTKTRAEVRGSGRKIWRQKGTGRARHGDRYAPIFVGGGVAHGPQPKNWSRKLPANMRRKALFMALSEKARKGEVEVVEGLEKLEPKTKIFWGVLRDKLKFDQEKERVLLIVEDGTLDVWRGVRNIANVEFTEARLLNVLEVLKHSRLLFTKNAIKELEKMFDKN